MHSLSQEIQTFSKNSLRKQCTRVTTLGGRQMVEKSDGSTVEIIEAQPGMGCGYVQDNSLDLQIGVIKPYLLLASQDAAHDLPTLRAFKVSHILNVAYGVENAFPDLFIYKTLNILDVPETVITSYFPDCAQFIEQAKAEILCGISQHFTQGSDPITLKDHLLLRRQYKEILGHVTNTKNGVVLVHCNAGVSRAASIVIGYLMSKDGLAFKDAFDSVKRARPSICPNSGFLQHLQNYKPQEGNSTPSIPEPN